MVSMLKVTSFCGCFLVFACVATLVAQAPGTTAGSGANDSGANRPRTRTNEPSADHAAASEDSAAAISLSTTHTGRRVR